MESYLKEQFIPWAEQHLKGKNSIYGEELKVDVCRTWVHVRGTKGRCYTYAKVRKSDECFYSASGSKPQCRYDNKEDWSRIRWPYCPKPQVDRHKEWPFSKWPPNVREYLYKVCGMTDASICRLVDADSYEAFVWDSRRVPDM